MFLNELENELDSMVYGGDLSGKQAGAVLEVMDTIQRTVPRELLWSDVNRAVQFWPSRLTQYSFYALRYSNLVVQHTGGTYPGHHCMDYWSIPGGIHNQHAAALAGSCVFCDITLAPVEATHILHTAQRNLANALCGSMAHQAYRSLVGAAPGWLPNTLGNIIAMLHGREGYAAAHPQAMGAETAIDEIRPLLVAYDQIVNACNFFTSSNPRPLLGTPDAPTCLELAAVIEYHQCRMSISDYAASNQQSRPLWIRHAPNPAPFSHPRWDMKCRFQRRLPHSAIPAQFFYNGNALNGTLHDESYDGFLFRTANGGLPPYCQGTLVYTKNGIQYQRTCETCWEQNSNGATEYGMRSPDFLGVLSSSI